MKLFPLLLLLPLLAHAATAPLHPDDFAYGMTLQGEGEGALYGFALPDEVYRHTVRSDLADLRIFNGNGEVVPHLLQHNPASEEIRQRLALPFYPLYADEVASGGETTLRIVPGQQGAVIDLRAQSPQEAKQRTISYFILDASALQQPIRQLAFRWQAGDETFITTVTVEQSSDLSHWQPLASGSLAELLYGDARMQRNEISLSGGHKPYLRVSWPLGARGVRLVAAEAEVAQPGAEPLWHWGGAQERPAAEADRYEFEALGRYPVERLQVVLPQENTMVRATISSTDEPQRGPWRVRYQGVLYSLRHEGGRIESGELPIAISNDRYWRIEVEQAGGGLGAGTPRLQLGWRPHRALFIARGTPPFTLAFGSARSEHLAQDRAVAGWLAAQQRGGAVVEMKTVQPQPLHTLGGESRLRPLPPPLPWKRWLLWGVLIIGVLAMLAMARSLYRQMNRS